MRANLDVERLRGRKPWTTEDGRAVVAAWRASGKSLAKFAGVHGLSPERIRWWGKRLGTTPASGVALVEVVSRGEASAFEVAVGAVVVRVPAGFDPAALRRLIEVLAAC